MADYVIKILCSLEKHIKHTLIHISKKWNTWNEILNYDWTDSISGKTIQSPLLHRDITWKEFIYNDNLSHYLCSTIISSDLFLFSLRDLLRERRWHGLKICSESSSKHDTDSHNHFKPQVSVVFSKELLQLKYIITPPILPSVQLKKRSSRGLWN